MDRQMDKTSYRNASLKLKKGVVKIRIDKQSGSKLDALSKLFNVIVATRVQKMLRTQSDSYEKSTVKHLSIHVCFDRGLANLLLFHRQNRDLPKYMFHALSFSLIKHSLDSDVTVFTLKLT